MARRTTNLLLATALLAFAPAASAATLRHQEQVNGDFTLFGNTLGHDCAGGIPAPIVGTVGACGTNTGDSAIDIFWQSNPGAGSATAGTGVTLAQSQSTATLDANLLPTNATVTYARLYWAAHSSSAAYGPSATLVTPDSVSHALTADPAASKVVNTGTYGYWYQSSADVTAIVKASSPVRGKYTVSGVTSVAVVGVNDNTLFDAWWIVVIFQNPADTALRQVTVFDGLDFVQSGAPADVTLGGFLVPSGGWDAKLGVVTYEGDASITGDSLLFQGYASTGADPTVLTTLSDALNPATNFFNGTRSWLGAARTVVGDLPQYSGAAGSMQSFDMDVVDLKANGAIHAGDDSAKIRATSTGDVYALGAFITSINTLKPSFITTKKSVTNLTRGSSYFAGDLLEYTIDTQNTGNDPSIQTVMQDILPAAVTYVPGTLQISQGQNAGSKTDATGDDQAEYLASTRTVYVRLGTGASAFQGGTMAIGETAQIKFRVTVNAGASGTIENRAEVVAAGLSGEPARTFDSNPPIGSGPTTVPVDQCLSDASCGGATPACLTTASPKVCVACTSSTYCGGGTPICDVAVHQCVGLTTLTPAAADETTVAGTFAPFATTLTSYLAGPETYDLDVVPACSWGVELRTAGGALVATRSTGGVWTIQPGYDTDADGKPDLGSTPGSGGTTSFVLRLTPPGGTSTGTTCTAAVSAVGHSTGVTAVAAATLHVGPQASWDPAYTSTLGTRKIVSSGGDVAFPGVIQNNSSAPLTFTLATALSASPSPGTLNAATYYSDPNGDGDPSDGAQITQIGPIAPYGGQAHVVVVVHAMTTSGTAVPTGTVITASSTATAGAVSATQTAEAQVQYAAFYADPARTVSRGLFAPCDTVYLGAQTLPTGFPFALEWYAKANPVRGTDTPFRKVDPWPVSGGAGTDQLQLPASALGTWTVLVVQKTSPVQTVTDTVRFRVERVGAFTSLSTPARLTVASGLSANASVTNQNGSAAYSGSQIAYTVTDGTRFMDGAGAFSTTPGNAHFTTPVDLTAGATASDAWSIAAPSWPAPGNYQLDAQWQVQCGGVTQAIANATTSFQVVPSAPVVTAPSGGVLLGTRTPTFVGTGYDGASVTVTVGGKSCGPAVVSGGSWTCTLPLASALADGAYSATAVQTVSGAVSDPSAAVAFTVDATPPAAPTLDPLLSPTGATVVPVKGTAEALSTVAIYLDAAWVGTVAAAASGAFTLPVAVAEGTRTFTARATDAAGNLSGLSNSVSVLVDRTPPAAPALSAIASPTNADPVVATGSAESGATVELFLDGASQGTTVAGPGFTFLLSGLAERPSPYSAYAVARDAAGNVSGPSTARAFVVDRSPPPAPTVVEPSNGAVLNAAQAPGGAVAFSGAAEAGAAVEVRVDGNVLAIVGAPAGTWSWTADPGLVNGLHLVDARATDAAGNSSAWSAAHSFTLDASGPLAPVLYQPASPTSASPVTVTGVSDLGTAVGVYLDGVFVGTADASLGAFSLDVTVTQGTRRFTARALDGAGNPSALSNEVAVLVDWTAPAAPTLDPLATPTNASVIPVTGTAEPLSTVTVFLDGASVGTVAAASGGTFTLPVAVGEGSHDFTARAADAAGNVSATSGAVTVVVDRTPPAAPTLDPLVTPTNATVVTVAGVTDAGTTVTVYRGGVAVGTVPDSAGRFSLDVAVAEGSHTFTAKAMDAAGNLSGLSNAVTVLVDRTAPAAPSLDPLVSPTSATVVPVTGSTDAGTVVTVYRDGVAVGTVPASGTRFSLPVAVFSGAVTFTATAADAAGNVSGLSNAVSVLVDHAAPADPVLDPLSSPTNAAVVVVTGTSDAGTDVTVRRDGLPVGVVPAPSGTFSLPVAVAEGAHAFTATAADAAGNVSGLSNTVTVLVDQTPPDAPLLASLDSPTGASTVSVVGTAEKGSLVTVTLDGAPVGTVRASAADGSFVLDVGVSQGTHDLVATATDPAGNLSPDSNTVTVVVDHTLPAPPVLGALVSPTNAATIAVSGTADPGSTVSVFMDGAFAGTVAAPAGTFTLVVAVPQGTLAFTATSRSAAGNVSALSNTVLVTVDRTAPPAAVVVAPANGAILGAAAAPGGDVTFLGTAEAGSTVEAQVDLVTTTVSAAPGTWTFALVLADGPHQVRARARDLAGNVGPWSAWNAFTLDTAAPGAPVLDPLSSPTIATSVTVTGTSEAGTSVTVLRDGVAVGSVTAPSGTFSLSVAAAEGSHTFTATASDVAGNVSGPSNAVSVLVDRTAPAAPILDPLFSPTNVVSVTVTGSSENGSNVTVYRDGVTVGTVAAPSGTFSLVVAVAEGTRTFTAKAADGAGNLSGVSNAVSVLVDRTPPAAPILNAVASPAKANPIPVSGTAEAGAVVELFLDGVSQGTAVAGPGFTFSLSGVPEGSHSVVAYARDAAGNLSPASATRSFTVDRTPPGAPAVVAPADGAVLDAAAAPGGSVSFSGSAESGTTVEVRVDGFVEGIVSASTGTWTATYALADGAHQVDARATDAAGNASGWSGANAFTLVTGSIAAPVLAALPSPTFASTVTVTGTSTVGSSVGVYLDGAFVATVAAPSAAFSLDVTVTEGTRTFTAVAEDGVGNVSPPSNAVSVVVDWTSPVAPVLTGPAAGAVLPAGAVVFSGTAEPNAVVEVVVNGVTYTTTAGAGGAFSVTATLPAGSWTAAVTATDAASNVSPPATVAFTTSTTAPPPPPGEGDGAHVTGGGCGCGPAGGSAPGALLFLALALALAPRRRAAAYVKAK